MLLLGLDFETTGLDPTVHSICEVGAVLYDAEIDRVVKQMSYVIDNPDAVWDDEVVPITRLNADICRAYGHDPEKSLRQLLSLVKRADAIFTHNGTSCDKPFLEAWCKKFGLELPEKLWIDTMVDIVYPPKWNKQLTCLAAYHEFLNPFPHNALADALTTLLIIRKHDLSNILERAKSPMVGVKALVDFNNNQLARKRGYFALYDKDKNGKDKFSMWVKNMKEMEVEAERAAAPFPIEIVPPVK